MDRQKNILTVLIIVSGIISLWGWFDLKHSEFIGGAFVQSYDVNSFIVKDSKTEKEVLTLTDSIQIFIRWHIFTMQAIMN